jgi:F-type H+-transporting ATPase subunit delta
MAGDSITVARPYAEAAFEVAKADGNTDAWAEGLATLSAVVSDPRIAEQIDSPNATPEQLRDLLFAVAGDGLSEHLQNLVRLLAANKRLVVLPEIEGLFVTMKKALDGLRNVEIASAYPLSQDAQAELAAKLKSHLGGDVDLTVTEDPDLIGGVKVRAGDIVIDGTLRGKLERLSNNLQF